MRVARLQEQVKQQEAERLLLQQHSSLSSAPLSIPSAAAVPSIPVTAPPPSYPPFSG
jgi:hypothetical protein